MHNMLATGPIEDLCDLVLEQFPDLRIGVDRPTDSSGSWFIDLELDKKLVTIQWRESQGFGLTPGYQSELHGYGEGPDELYPDVESCFARIVYYLCGE
jgi:hypothetical protein